jgi:hypothetical protein
MRRILELVAALALVAGVVVLADEAKPVVSADQRAIYWRAVADFNSAQTRLQAVVNEMKATCKEYGLTTGGDGEPMCGVVKPPSPPRVEVPKPASDIPSPSPKK